MKHLTLLFCALLALNIQPIATNTLLDSNTRSYGPCAWLKPENIEVISDNGNVTLIQRVCQITRNGSYGRNKKFIVLLFFPEEREVWMGDICPRYIVLSKKILGFQFRASDFLVKESFKADSFILGTELNYESILNKYLVDSTNATPAWIDEIGISKRIDLRRIYGSEALNGRTSMMRLDSQNHTIDQISINGSLLDISFTSYVGRHLKLSFTSNYEVINAGLDNLMIPVLCGDPEQHPEFAAWSFPLLLIETNKMPPYYSIRVIGENGEKVALAQYRNYSVPDNSVYRWDSEGIVARVGLIYLPNNGIVWLGPIKCHMATIGDIIWGIQVDKTLNQVLIYTGRKVKIPMSVNCSDALRKEIRQFEENLKRNQYRIEPNAKINIAGLFNDYDILGKDCEYSFREICVNGGNMIIRLSTSHPRIETEITVNADLQVNSKRVINYDSIKLQGK